MDKLTIENFRCFRQRQTARLAPLTLLVGDNSTGKTSFMAMTRILWDIVYLNHRRPDFKKEPYDLGSFREIVNLAEDSDNQVQAFIAGFGIGDWNCEAEFRQGSISTEVCKLSIANPQSSISWYQRSSGSVRIEARTARDRWQFQSSVDGDKELDIPRESVSDAWGLLSLLDFPRRSLRSVSKSSPIQSRDFDRLSELVLTPYHSILNKHRSQSSFSSPTATAPVRSRPRRTYDPGPGFLDPEGAGVPEFLAALTSTNHEQWEKLKSEMEVCGQQTGVFDEIQIDNRGGESGSDPFHVQVRKHLEDGQGPWRNLVDVGYGVSQILPLIFELNRPDAPFMLLLQQPEVHLHPSAQAGLGSILCNVAATRRQILVETHSYHIVDRVRLDVRDSRTELKPEDVSILFFERQGHNVHIHSIDIDGEGNIHNAPPGYRNFFMEEVERSLDL